MEKKYYEAIRIEDQMPEDYQNIVVIMSNGDMAYAMYCDDEGSNFTSDYFKSNPNAEITHWLKPVEVPATVDAEKLAIGFLEWSTDLQKCNYYPIYDQGKCVGWENRKTEEVISHNDLLTMYLNQKQKEMKTVEENFKQYRRKQIAELRPVTEEDIKCFQEGDSIPASFQFRVSISDADRLNGSPAIGDMVARNPKNHNDHWLVAKQYFEDNFEPIP